MLFKTFAILALAIGVIANEAAAPRPRTNAEALARGLPILNPRGGGYGGGGDHNDHHDHGHGGHKPRPSGKPTPTQAGPDPDFVKTCDWFDVEFSNNRPILRALCKDNRGKKQYSQINLNQCIKLNNDGKLTCAPGGFVGRSRRGRDLESAMIGARHGDHNDGGQRNKKCTGCEVVSGDTIECSCPIKTGGRIDSSYTLGNCISNNNGRLTCKSAQD
ncbi:hypothetical protein CspHIS471_0108480 [Cutaneotrichosporon sp. HIS471]|nr:hypothetical protein CspHIS471_0108480 [Cutaneotrichosporon sp. HIS471]